MSDLLAYARELEAEDTKLAEAIARVEATRAAATERRARAEQVEDVLRRLPEARGAVAEAESELERRRADLVAAEAELERATKEDAVLEARRSVVRTGDLVGGAERKVERLRAEARELAEKARAMKEEFPELERATQVAASAARAEAALFVELRGLEAQRERVIRQANELGASALGEPLVSVSVSLVRERLERLR